MRAILVCLLTIVGMSHSMATWAEDDFQIQLLPPIEPAIAELADSTDDDSTVETASAEVDVSTDPTPPEPGEEVADLIAEPWYYPSAYFASECWESSFEFGINGSTGNSETISFRTGADVTRKDEFHELKLDFDYSRTSSDGVLTQNKGSAAARHDWKYEESCWSIFAKGRGVYDQFRAFDVRLEASAGFGYSFIDTDDVTLKGRWGPGVSREIGGPDDSYIPEMVWGADYKHKLNDRQKLEGNIEYFPQWDNPRDFRIESKLSWAIQLDEGGDLSLKLSIIDRYDSTPNGARPNDLDYAMLLLWKL